MTDREESSTLLHWLTREFPKGKRETFKQMLARGRIRINGQRAIKLAQPLRPKDNVVILPHDAGGQAGPAAPLPSLRPLTLVHEDADVLVIEKPAGLLTSTIEGEKRATALAIVRRYVAAREPDAPVGLIHRLDRDASGLLIFSKSHRAYKSLKTQFFKHTVERAYEAIVEGIPNPRQGRIESHLLERADGSVNSLPREVHGKGQRAITDYEVVEVIKPQQHQQPRQKPPHAGVEQSGTPRSATPDSSIPRSTAKKKKIGPRARLLVHLLTGRKHQIRAHLASRGHPVVNDPVYGKPTHGKKMDGELQLRAIRLVILHPATGERKVFELPRKGLD